MRMAMLAVGGWVVAAALTVGVSWTAISVVQDSVVPRTDVRSALPTPEETAASPTGTRPTPRPTASTPAAPRVRAFVGQGGTATVRCADGVPTFVNLTPKQGFEVRRDDSSAEVEFSSPGHRTEITVTCAGGSPDGDVEEEEGGRGGDDDSSGRSGGGDDD